MLLLFLAACDKPPPAAAPPCDRCVLTDANNYTWASTLTASEWHLGAGADATIDWSTLDRDMYGDAFDPAADVARVALLALPGLTPAEVAAGLAADALQQSNVGLFVFCQPEGPSCRLSDFELFGNGLAVEEYFVEGTGTWLLALLTPEDTLGSVAFLLPDAGSAEHTVDLSAGATTLDVDVDFRSLEPVVVAPGEAFHVEWAGLTRDGLGNDLAIGTLDRLVVGRFDQPLEDVEDRVHALLDSADALWTMDVAGTEADLSALVGDAPFPGVDADATWLLALYCSSCLNPAPRFATVLAAAED